MKRPKDINEYKQRSKLERQDAGKEHAASASATVAPDIAHIQRSLDGLMLRPVRFDVYSKP